MGNLSEDYDVILDFFRMESSMEPLINNNKNLGRHMVCRSRGGSHEIILDMASMTCPCVPPLWTTAPPRVPSSGTRRRISTGHRISSTPLSIMTFLVLTVAGREDAYVG